MSTLVSSFVQDRVSAKNLPTASLISGAAKSYSAVNQTVATPVFIPPTFNASSLVDTGIGLTAINFTALFTVSSRVVACGTAVAVDVSAGSSTTLINLHVYTSSTGAYVDNYGSTASFGDLA